MLHLTVFCQLMGLLLGFGSLLITVQLYFRYSERLILFFSLSALFVFIRTLIFTVSNYSKAARDSFLSYNFEWKPQTGLVYILLISLALYFLMRGLFALAGERMPLWLSAVYWIYYGIDLFLFVYLIIERWPPDALAFLFEFRFIADVPFYAGKILFLFMVPSLLMVNHRHGLQGPLFPLLLFVFLGVQAADAVYRLQFFAPPVTLCLYFFLPAAAYFLVLPRIMKRRRLQERDGENLLAGLAESCGLTPEEVALVKDILEGKSNKEIAFEQDLTLAVVKHRLFKLYKKCRVQSRWELFALFQDQS